MKTKKRAKQFVEVCIWETSDGGDPWVFVARTKECLYAAVWGTLKERWRWEVGDKKPPRDPFEAINAYAEKVNRSGEYFTWSTEEVL